ncbi:hypothetical protein J6590_025144 [Homalodisca vitripennis]|nr:hypothetical protein J6590_025144 [Homalodisca vitripennis]
MAHSHLISYSLYEGHLPRCGIMSNERYDTFPPNILLFIPRHLPYCGATSFGRNDAFIISYSLYEGHLPRCGIMSNERYDTFPPNILLFVPRHLPYCGATSFGRNDAFIISYSLYEGHLPRCGIMSNERYDTFPPNILLFVPRHLPYCRATSFGRNYAFIISCSLYQDIYHIVEQRLLEEKYAFIISCSLYKDIYHIVEQRLLEEMMHS